MPKLPKDEVDRLKEMVPTVDELRIIDLMRDYRAIRKRRLTETQSPRLKKFNRDFFHGKRWTRLSGFDDRRRD